MDLSYSIFDAQGELMIDANPGGGGDLNKQAIEIAVADGDTIISSGYHKEIKADQFVYLLVVFQC